MKLLVATLMGFWIIGSVYGAQSSEAVRKPCVKKDFESTDWTDPDSKEFLARFKQPSSPAIKKSGRPRIELWTLVDVAESPGFNPASCLGNIETKVEQITGPALKIENKNGAPLIKGPVVSSQTSYAFKFHLKNASGEKDIVAELLVRP